MRTPPLDWTRKLGVFLVAAGSLVFGGAAIPSLYGAAMAKVAVARFRAQSSNNQLWNSARVRAYQETLALSFPAPEAVLRIPKAGIEAPVLEGTSALTLNRGLGHIPGTARPGESGNLAITGHRDGFFRGLKDVAAGDVIELDLPASQASDSGNQASDSPSSDSQRTEHYIVRSIRIVSPQDTSVLRPTAGATLTLVTCYPFYFIGRAPQRYIVQAARVPNVRPASSRPGRLPTSPLRTN